MMNSISLLNFESSISPLQQTPKPEAQFPDAVPPILEQSEEL